MTGGLRLFVQCHSSLLALETAVIERVVLAEEVRILGGTGLRAPALREAGPADLPPIQVGAATYAAWDLGRMLGLPEVTAAFVLLRQPGARGSLSLALRTGPCVRVSVLPSDVATPLPDTLFRARAGALRGVFPIESRGGDDQRGSSVGYDLALERLWSREEMAFSEATLASLGSAV